MFLRNAWYVACKSDEIQEKPLGRRICNERMAFYRLKDGSPVAVEDFCPHRGAPLSLGYVRDDKLVCGYHGLEMGCDGKVVAMPGQRVRGFPAIKSFAVSERHGFVWVWPGDKGVADPARMPELMWASNPEWAYGGGYHHICADYRLTIDNLILRHGAPLQTERPGADRVHSQRPEQDLRRGHVDAVASTGQPVGPPESGLVDA